MRKLGVFLFVLVLASAVQAGPRDGSDGQKGLGGQPAEVKPGPRVHVKGYRRKDGTYVAPHTRSYPHSKSRPSEPKKKRAPRKKG